MAEVEAEGFTEALEAASEDLAMEAARRWHSEASDYLQKIGDELEYEVFPVVQAFQPPQWDSREHAAVFNVNHVAARFFEHGTTKHEVKGNPWLAFEWEEMANEEFGDTGMTFKERFEDTWPTVFFRKTEPEGVERIGYMEHGRGKAARWLRSQQG